MSEPQGTELFQLHTALVVVVASGKEGKSLDAKLKHLEFIQAAIARMATNSFLFKGWAITIAAAMAAFSAADSKAGLLAIALISTVLFWGLDGYYLWLERGFIVLHDRVASMDATKIDFSMKLDKADAVRAWLKTCRRPHLCAFYGTIVILDLIGIVLEKAR